MHVHDMCESGWRELLVPDCYYELVDSFPIATYTCIPIFAMQEQ